MTPREAAGALTEGTTCSLHGYRDCGICAARAGRWLLEEVRRLTARVVAAEGQHLCTRCGYVTTDQPIVLALTRYGRALSRIQLLGDHAPDVCESIADAAVTGREEPSISPADHVQDVEAALTALRQCPTEAEIEAELRAFDTMYDSLEGQDQAAEYYAALARAVLALLLRK